MLMRKGVFLIFNTELLLTEVILESKETKYCSSLPETFKVISILSGITRGLAFKLWGAIGVTTNPFTSGVKIGPPQLKEYPVEPPIQAIALRSVVLVLFSIHPQRLNKVSRLNESQ